jgi:hypothetical protein
MSGETLPGGVREHEAAATEHVNGAIVPHPEVGPRTGESTGWHGETVVEEREIPRNPSELAGERFGDVLDQMAQQFAPGAASADWDQWPADPRSGSPVPCMIRIGRVGKMRHPILIPGVGQGSIILGNPTLARPVTPTAPAYGQHTSRELVRRAQEEAAADTAERNQARVAQLKAEHDTAAIVTASYLTRAVCSVQPGSMEVTLYDPRDTGAAFTGFAPMAGEGMYTVLGSGGISGLLRELNGDITSRYQNHLDGFPTLRASAEYLDQAPPVPYKVVALLGNGEQLGPEDQKLLDHAVVHASRVGITLLLHGFGPSRADTPTHSVALDTQQRRAETAAVTPDEFGFQLDPAPTPQIMWHAAHGAIYDLQPLAAIPRRPVSETAPIMRPTLAEYNATLPAHRYRRRFTHELRGMRDIQRNTAYVERTYPFIQPETVRHAEIQTARLLQRSGNPRAALNEARDTFVIAGTDYTRALASAAELSLHRGQWSAMNRARAMQYGTAAGEVTHRMLDSAMDLIRYSRGRTLAALPHFMHRYLAEHQPDQPPAWIYQLAIDQGVHRGGLTRNNTALEVIVEDLEATHTRGAHNVQLRHEDGRLDTELVEALAELRLLHLYGYNQMTADDEAMRTLLTRRAELHVRDIDPTRLPPGARSMQRLVLQHLDVIGRTVTTGERASSVAASAGGVLSSLWSFTGRGRDKAAEDGKAEGDDPSETAPAEPPAN